MFRKAVVMNKRRAKAGYISVRKSVEGFTEIVVHQDGGSRGPGQTSPAKFAPRTIVGTSNTSVTPTILAARREMQQWRFLAFRTIGDAVPRSLSSSLFNNSEWRARTGDTQSFGGGG